MSKFNYFKVLLCAQLISICFCSDLYSDRVRKYDSESFKVNVGRGVPHFVNFFAPWCGYCKRLKPVWDELSEKYNVDSPNQKIVIAKVDCTSETPLCAEENVSGYPSLIFYDAGDKRGVKYQGKRDLAGLQEFISQNLGGTLTKQTVLPVKTPTETYALELTDEDFHSTIDFGLHFVKFYAPWCGHCQKMAGEWEELALNAIEDKSVTISSVDCTKHKRACQDFEVKGFPTILWIVDGKKLEKYQGGRNFEAFKKFITDMKQANEKRIQNEEGRIPDATEDYPDMVVELVKDNFENAIANGYSFVKFFVPWCGHSKRLAPTWNNLAIKFASAAHVKVAKVNCIQSEEVCEKYKIVGYPSLVLFHNGKLIKEYSGPRKLDDLHSFLLDNMHHHTEL